MTIHWTIKKVLDWAAEDFKKRQMETPRLEAELLLSHLLKKERIYLYTNFDRPLSSSELEDFRNIVARRRKGECAAYITGEKEFWSLSFTVTPGVLVPRPDTETLVQEALPHLQSGDLLLDLCTGSGCVAIALATECPEIQVHAADKSREALDVAEMNVERHGLSDRIQLLHGDLFDAVLPGTRYNCIVSNPPYVPDERIATLAPEVQMEPRIALAGGADGLDIIRRILSEASAFLAPNGHLLIELDPDQATEAAENLGPSLLNSAGTIHRDLAGRQRVVSWCLDQKND